MGTLVFDANKTTSYILPMLTKIKTDINNAYSICDKVKWHLPSSFSYRSTLTDMCTNLNNIKNQINNLKISIEKKVEISNNLDLKNRSRVDSLSRQAATIGTIETDTGTSKGAKNIKSATKVKDEKENTGAKISKKISSFFKKFTSGIKDVAAKISNSFKSLSKKLTNGIKKISKSLSKFKNDTSKLLSSAGGKISTNFSSTFKEKENKNVVVNSVADETKDKDGWFEKTTLLNENGSRIVYDKKQKLEDGTIEYYGENGKVIKRINVDGSCEFYAYDNADYFYDSLGRKCGGTWTASAFGVDINKIVVSKDGTKEFYNGKQLKRKEFPDGTYEKYYESSLQKVKEVCSPDGSSKKYKEYKGTYYLAGEYNVDGSHKIYNSSNQLIEEKNADGSCKVYSNKVWDVNLQKFVFDDNKTILSYEKKSDGTEYEYEYNKYGYLTIKCSDGSEKCYDNNNVFTSEKLSDGTRKTYYKESGKIDGIENPDGSKKYYYENGNLRSEIDSAGNKIEYREDGTKRTEIKNNETIFYDEKGNVKDHRKSDGSSVNYWSDGSKVINYSDGTSKRYSPTGKLVFEKDKNGIQTSYSEAGKITQKSNLDGSYTTYDEQEKPYMTIYPGGNIVFH